MRIAGNKVKHLVSFFHSELGGLYSRSEVDELAFRVFEHVLKFKREEMHARQEDLLNQSELLLIYDAAKDLATSKPLQYVLGEAYFYRFLFYVNEQVLIPRPETEELVDMIYSENKDTKGSLLDVGTGSGCIAVSLKSLLPKFDVAACDISDGALQVAVRNAERNKTVVKFIKSNILDAFDEGFGSYSIIVSNPPYIKLSEAEQIHENVKDHEPHLALFVEGSDAIIFYKRIIDLCEAHLEKYGKLYFELNPITAEEVKSYAQATSMFSGVDLIKDMSGNLRFFRAVKA